MGQGRHAGGSFWGCLRSGLTAYCLSGLIVALGVSLGLSKVEQSTGMHSPRLVASSESAFRNALSQWDGQWYLQIAAQGYRYDPNQQSSVAFFPLYPLLVAAVFRLTGMPLDLAGLLVSHVFLIGTFVLLLLYVRQRFPEASKELPMYAVLAFGLFPVNFFLWMTYTESLFVFLCMLALYGIERRWSPIVIALTIGLVTAARSVGVVLVLPLALYAWRTTASKWQAAGRLAYLVPIACLGLLEYTCFQYVELGNALAFVQTQQHWGDRPPIELAEKLTALLALEPIWSIYVPSMRESWWPAENDPSYLFSLRFANPVFFLLGVGLILLGARQRWLSSYELLLAAGLLAVGYFARGYEMCMQSQGRFVAVVFPIYLVLGNVLCRVSTLLAGGLIGLSALYLGIYSAMLAAQYVLI